MSIRNPFEKTAGNPTAIRADGSKEWYRDGKLHREDGPAIERANGDKEWYRNGRLHREDGPAIERADGSKLWYRDNKLHRADDEPAFEGADGSKEWWRDGVRLNDVEVAKILQKQKERAAQLLADQLNAQRLETLKKHRPKKDALKKRKP